MVRTEAEKQKAEAEERRRKDEELEAEREALRAEEARLAKERRENSTSHKIFRELKNFFGKMISEDE